MSCFFIYHASDKIAGILLDRSWSHDTVIITQLGIEICIGRVISKKMEVSNQIWPTMKSLEWVYFEDFLSAQTSLQFTE